MSMPSVRFTPSNRHSTLLLQSLCNTPFSFISYGDFLKEYATHAVRDYIIDRMNALVG